MVRITTSKFIQLQRRSEGTVVSCTQTQDEDGLEEGNVPSAFSEREGQ